MLILPSKRGGAKKRLVLAKELAKRFQEEGLFLYKSINNKRESYLYEDNILQLSITKRNEKIDIKMSAKKLLDEKETLFHIAYDIENHIILKDVQYKENIKNFIGLSEDVHQLLALYRQLTVNKAEELFQFQARNIINADEVTPVLTNQKASSIIIDELERLLLAHEFTWEQIGEIERYQTNNGEWTIEISLLSELNKKELLIKNKGIFIANITCLSDSKEIVNLDMNKGIMHKMQETNSFVSSLQNILFYCLDNDRHQDKLQEIVSHLNQHSYAFHKKIEKVEEEIAYLTKHHSLLSIEDSYILENIRDKKLPEVIELQKKLLKNNSNDNELLKMIDILYTSLLKIRKTVEKLHYNELHVSERLIQKLEEDSK
ncbi:hypothetical protein CN918_32075 [Priestia megaterium]|nr:hypothetical protein CN918_32075 [Priestia megaterium]